MSDITALSVDEAKQHIDRAIADISGQKLVDASSMIDVLLDLRRIVAPAEETS